MQNDVAMTITMMQGKFITFEGSEGAGKTTQITKLASFLEANGIDVIVTREPGGTPLGEKIRALLLNDEMDEVTELLLMFAARREHWITKIKPALDAGTWVISDRFTESSFAYQGFARGLSLEMIETLERVTLEMPRADLTFWFDIPVEIGLKRARSRDVTDRFEQEKITFFEKVNAGFKALYESGKRPIVRIDATQTISEIEADIKRGIDARFPRALGVAHES